MTAHDKGETVRLWLSGGRRQKMKEIGLRDWIGGGKQASQLKRAAGVEDSKNNEENK